jgi:hypothetical protein
MNTRSSLSRNKSASVIMGAGGIYLQPRDDGRAATPSAEMTDFRMAPVMARVVRATSRGSVLVQVARTSRAMTNASYAMTNASYAMTNASRAMTNTGRATTR